VSDSGRTLALAAVSAVAGAGCARLFGDAGWVVPVFVAVAGAHTVGALTRRWSGRAAGAAHGVGLALLLAGSVGGHTAYGIPTPATMSALGRAISRAPDAVRAAIAPAPTTPELILLVVAGLWIAVAVADGLAHRRRAGLAAVLPLAVLPIVVAALGTDRLRAPLTFALAAAIALYATVDRAADSRRAVPRVFAPHAHGRRGAGGTATGPRRAVVLAGPAVALGLAAVLLGPVVPGVGRAVVDVHAFGVTLDVSRIELNPMVDIQPQLLAARRTELFTVRATAPAYWRLTALDRFDGRRWSPSRPALHRRDGRVPDPAPPTPERSLAQDFELSTLDSPWLPAADRAIRVKAAGARLDPETGSLVTKNGSRSVRTYRVESRLPPGPPRRLPSSAGPTATARRDTAAAPPSGARRLSLGRYLGLPERFPARVRHLAERFTAGAVTPSAKAAALERRLRADFAYDENAPSGGSVEALDHFLLTSRRGFCEQFAGAFAAMARAVGLPARVAVGFTPGDYDAASGVWRVTTREAHAWPEVFLDGSGWTAFEPTPGRALPDPDARVETDVAVQRVAAAGPSATGGGQSALARVDPGGGAGLDAGPGGRPGGLAGAVSSNRTLWWLAAAALGLLAGPPAAKARRRTIRRRARADAAVLAAWAEALDRLAEAGLDRRAAETPLEYAGRAGAVHPGVAPPMRRLAAFVNTAAYGPPDTGNAAEAWSASDQVARALDAHDPGWVRWRRRLDPRSLRARPASP
jgi:transglutaminase-like putative cysteine protease